LAVLGCGREKREPCQGRGRGFEGSPEEGDLRIQRSLATGDGSGGPTCSAGAFWSAGKVCLLEREGSRSGVGEAQ